MEGWGAGLALLAVALGASWAASRLPPPWARGPVLLAGLLAAAAAFEAARYDHGFSEALFAVGFVGAPVVAIFGGAAAGARRFWGWPDLGPVPGRLALVAAFVLLGVLAGSRVKESDVLASVARGDEVRTALAAWRAAHGGAWPDALEQAVPGAPRTRMGAVAPPPFAYDAAARTLSFPIGGGRRLQADLEREDAPWRSP